MTADDPSFEELLGELRDDFPDFPDVELGEERSGDLGPQDRPRFNTAYLHLLDEEERT